MLTPEVLRAVRAASVAELSSLRGESVRVRGVLPLVGPRGPVLAYPYARRALAQEVAMADAAVVLTLSESRGTGEAFRPLALRCRPRLTEDPEGERFVEELLEQELLRWPPARAYADSPLLMREYWWWLPRLLVDLEVLEVESFAARSSPREQVLAVERGGEVAVALARVSDDALADPLRLDDVDVLHGTPGAGSAVLFGQDLSFPDLEQWGQWSWEGDWDGAVFEVRRAPESVGLPPVPGVMQRWRRHRTLERECKRALRDQPSG